MGRTQLAEAFLQDRVRGIPEGITTSSAKGHLWRGGIFGGVAPGPAWAAGHTVLEGKHLPPFLAIYHCVLQQPWTSHKSIQDVITPMHFSENKLHRDNVSKTKIPPRFDNRLEEKGTSKLNLIIFKNSFIFVSPFLPPPFSFTVNQKYTLYITLRFAFFYCFIHDHCVYIGVHATVHVWGSEVKFIQLSLLLPWVPGIKCMSPGWCGSQCYLPSCPANPL